MPAAESVSDMTSTIPPPISTHPRALRAQRPQPPYGQRRLALQNSDNLRTRSLRSSGAWKWENHFAKIEMCEMKQKAKTDSGILAFCEAFGLLPHEAP
jgi:hypothetical protein